MKTYYKKRKESALGKISKYKTVVLNMLAMERRDEH
jgi:hypothetical protein